ncbi:MAG TPA: M20/M25/M40 family metallo-hydrolase, partial [Acidobacteriota bacterium]|nr:M20/M25/M40 family metallo-hydrolase [Acidobacteriota bacterium]
MRILAVLILLFAVVASAESPTVDAVLQKEYPSLEALYKQLHQSPELSYYEVKTSARIADELQKLGFEVTREFGHFQNPKITAHGIVAVMKNGKGPTVLVRTELDGLPVEEKTQLPYASTAMGKNDAGEDVHLMHACGHDIHMTVFVGTARALSSMRDRWKGTLIMIGQPSEERGPGGAEALLNAGLFTKFPKPDYCLALHDSATLEAGKVGWVE